METFEQYLEWCFNEDYSEGILDDDLSDAQDNWIADLDGESLIRFGQDYGRKMYLLGQAEVLNNNEKNNNKRV